MSEKEKSIIRRISDTVTKLDKEKQNYIVGLTEGMALAREEEKQRNKQLQEALQE